MRATTTIVHRSFALYGNIAVGGNSCSLGSSLGSSLAAAQVEDTANYKNTTLFRNIFKNTTPGKLRTLESDIALNYSQCQKANKRVETNDVKPQQLQRELKEMRNWISKVLNCWNMTSISCGRYHL